MGLVSRLRYGAPQWAGVRTAAVMRAKARLPRGTVDGTVWYWPSDEAPLVRRSAAPDVVRLLAPFDPFVWDRVRFELFNAWAYRFEAYTPAPKRVRGYYSLPMMWRDTVVGWGNLSVRDGVLVPQFGYVAGQAPKGSTFQRALDAEVARFEHFMSL